MGVRERLYQILTQSYSPSPPPMRCPSCRAPNLRILGSNAARLNGRIEIALTCEKCGVDCLIDSNLGWEPYIAREQARVVNHGAAEIWDTA